MILSFLHAPALMQMHQSRRDSMYRMYGQHIRTCGKVIEVRKDSDWVKTWLKVKECETEEDAHVEALLMQTYLLAVHNVA